MRFTHYGPPIVKKRARMGAQGRFYAPERSDQHEKQIALTVMAGLAGHGGYGDVPIELHAQFFMPTARRVDGDNLMKALLDGCEKGGLFDDDKQVLFFSARVFHRSDNPRTEWVATPLFEHPHAIFCRGAMVTPHWAMGEWFCPGCGDAVSDWMVQTQIGTTKSNGVLNA